MNSPLHFGQTHEDTPTPDLVKQVLADSRELVALELRLALDELRGELILVKRAVVLGGAGLLLGLVGMTSLVVALILALGGRAFHAAIIGGGLMVVAIAIGAIALHLLPKKPLEKTLERLKEDVNRLKEHVG
ncbi:MAG: phage holin family protein [Polyangiaceae bacterium]